MPKYQGGVIGYLLTQAAIREAKDMECKAIILHVINRTMSKLLEGIFKFKVTVMRDMKDYNAIATLDL